MERPTRKRSTVIILVATAALLFFSTACTCCWVPGAVQRAGSFGRAMPWRNWLDSSLGWVEAREEVNRSFDVTAPLALQVHVSVGSVRVQTGAEGTVQVQGTRRAWGSDAAAAATRLSDFQVAITQPDPAMLVIEGDAPRAGEAQPPQADLVITVPPHANVQATVNVGSLEVEGVTGTLDLTGNVGEVAARDVHLSGASHLSTNVGDVSVRLPASLGFQLDARASVGDVSCAFPLLDETTSSTLVGKSLSGHMGAGSPVTLTLRVHTGDVRVERGQ